MKDFILEAQDLTREVRLLADCCIRPSFHLFYSTDVGDSIYDSAILLDNIRFTPRSTP